MVKVVEYFIKSVVGLEFMVGKLMFVGLVECF